MADLIARKNMCRFFDSGDVKDLEDEVVSEFRLHLHMDGEPFLQTTISPSLVEEFVVGFLRTRGLIDGIQDIISINVTGDVASVTRVPQLYGMLPQLNLLESTGSRNRRPEELLTGMVAGTDFRVPARSLIRGVLMLSEMPLFKRTGGTHCAILFSPSADPFAFAEDIGRHNAVDKVIGSALMKGLDFNQTWLAVSGRLPADMVLKPALVGIPLVASVSAPTAEGIEMGDRAGVTVVGFTRGGRLNCYTHWERITS